jgi:hypothetical protein
MTFLLGIGGPGGVVPMISIDRFPWRALLLWFAAVAIVTGGATGVLIAEFHAHFVRHWPFLVR